MKTVTKLISVFLFILGIGNCTTYYRASYNMELLEVERPVQAKERYGQQKIIQFEEEEITKFSFEDEMIKIIWLPLNERFWVSLENKTDHSIKIIWNETVFVDENKVGQRVTHSGVNYTERNASQPPSVIVRKGILTDVIVPVDNIYYVRGEDGGWRISPILPDHKSEDLEETKQIAEKYIDKKLQILLPLQIEDVINEYIFIFTVTKAKVEMTKYVLGEEVDENWQLK